MDMPTYLSDALLTESAITEVEIMKISCNVLINEENETVSLLTNAAAVATSKLASSFGNTIQKRIVKGFQKKIIDFGITDTVLINQVGVKKMQDSKLNISIDADITSYTEIIQLVEKLLTEKASEQINMLVLPALDIIGQNLSTETINTLLVGYFANEYSNTGVCNLINDLLEHKGIKIKLSELKIEQEHTIRC